MRPWRSFAIGYCNGTIAGSALAIVAAMIASFFVSAGLVLTFAILIGSLTAITAAVLRSVLMRPGR